MQPKPRELFRSPSAPPVVPARRTKLALQRSQERGGDTPLGVPRARSALMQEALPEVDATSCEMSCENEEDTSASFLNRYGDAGIFFFVELLKASFFSEC